MFSFAEKPHACRTSSARGIAYKTIDPFSKALLTQALPRHLTYKPSPSFLHMMQDIVPEHIQTEFPDAIVRRANELFRPILLPFVAALHLILGQTPTRYLWPGVTVSSKLQWTGRILEEIRIVIDKAFKDDSEEVYEMFREMLDGYELCQRQLQKKPFFGVWGWGADLNEHMAKCRDLWDYVLQQAGIDLEKRDSHAIKDFIKKAREEAERDDLSSPSSPMSPLDSPFLMVSFHGDHFPHSQGPLVSDGAASDTDESTIGEMQEVFKSLRAPLSTEYLAAIRNGSRRRESLPVHVPIPLPLNSSDSIAPSRRLAECPNPY